MKFQVVLQWPASSVNDFDRMVEIEHLLVEKLGEQVEVDRHDFGSGEMNIFLHTNDPRRAFEQIRRGIAYREVDELNTTCSRHRRSLLHRPESGHSFGRLRLPRSRVQHSGTLAFA